MTDAFRDWLKKSIDDTVTNYAHWVLEAVLTRYDATRPAENDKNAEIHRLRAIIQEIVGELYGKGFEVSGWHLNGELEPLDRWFEDNFWVGSDDPETSGWKETPEKTVEVINQRDVVCPRCNTPFAARMPAHVCEHEEGRITEGTSWCILCGTLIYHPPDGKTYYRKPAQAVEQAERGGAWDDKMGVCVHCGHPAGEHNFWMPGNCLADGCKCKAYAPAKQAAPDDTNGICPKCHERIDTNTCWCGESMSVSRHDNHDAIPMGCKCYFADNAAPVVAEPQKCETCARVERCRMLFSGDKSFPFSQCDWIPSRYRPAASPADKPQRAGEMCAQCWICPDCRDDHQPPACGHKDGDN